MQLLHDDFYWSLWWSHIWAAYYHLWSNRVSPVNTRNLSYHVDDMNINNWTQCHSWWTQQSLFLALVIIIIRLCIDPIPHDAKSLLLLSSCHQSSECPLTPWGSVTPLSDTRVQCQCQLWSQVLLSLSCHKRYSCYNCHCPSLNFILLCHHFLWTIFSCEIPSSWFCG